MTLTYRGVHYQLTLVNSMQASDREVVGQYRGVPVRISAPAVALKSTVPLSYRGVSYAAAY